MAPHQDPGTLFDGVSQQVRGADEDRVGHHDVRRLRRDRFDQSVVLAAPRTHEKVSTSNAIAAVPRSLARSGRSR